MNKSYSNGYALGQQDGAHGENKLPSRAWVRALSNIGNYLPGAENRDDEWVKGYRQGFEDQVRQINVAQHGGERAMESGSGKGYSKTMSAASSGGGANTFAHRIAVARNLYEQAAHLRHFLVQTREDFQSLFSHHDLLVGEFFYDLLTHNVQPRIRQIADLANDVGTQDQPKIQTLIQKYEQAIHGMERGLANATAYFSSINLAAANQLSGLAAVVGAGDPRDYETQLAVAQSIRRTFEALLTQLDAIGHAYDTCARDHDELMRQDFDALIRENIKPRLQEISDLWRAVRDRDLAAIDGMIARLRTVALT